MLEKIKTVIIGANYCLLAMLAVCVRIVAKGASIGDALAIAALCALVGLVHYINSKKEPPINESIKKTQAEIRQEIDDLKSAINAIKIGKSLGRF